MKKEKIYFIRILLILFLCIPVLVPAQEKRDFHSHSLLAQEILLQLPAFNKQNVFGPGIGGSLLYENYALNKLIHKNKTLPGIVWGLTASLFNFFPETETAEFFGDSALFNLGLHLGYQFYLPLGSELAFSPTVFCGTRYYFNFHYFNQFLHSTRNPIFTGGLIFNFIHRDTINTALALEYGLYYEQEPAHTLQIALRTGWYF